MSHWKHSKTERNSPPLQNNKITTVSKMAQQEKGRQLNESVELTDPLNKRIEEILKVKGEVPSLTSYPSLETLWELESDEIDLGQYWYYAIKAEQIKKKMDQATKAFHERDEYYRDPKLYDSFYTEYTRHIKGLHQQLKTVDEILSKQKTDTGIYEYLSSPSLVLHLGELDDKPKEYFERTKREVSHKNVLARWVHQYKMQNVDMSDDERKVDQDYQKFKRKQSQVYSICEKKIQEIEEQDYLSLKGSRSVSDLSNEEEIKAQHVKPIGGNTLPPYYSREISRYQPSDKERVKAMKDALSAVRWFTSNGNLSRNENLNTTTMKEMWDYVSQEPFWVKPKVFLEWSLKDLKIYSQYPKLSVNCVVSLVPLVSQNAPWPNPRPPWGSTTFDQEQPPPWLTWGWRAKGHCLVAQPCWPPQIPWGLYQTPGFYSLPSRQPPPDCIPPQQWMMTQGWCAGCTTCSCYHHWSLRDPPRRQVCVPEQCPGSVLHLNHDRLTGFKVVKCLLIRLKI